MSGVYFTKIYEKWSDSRLIDEYVADGYTADARKAMAGVLAKRGLLEEAEEKAGRNKQKEEDRASEHSGLFSQPIQADLNDNLSDSEYAEQSISGDVYFEKIMMTGASSNLFGFTVAMAITAVVFLAVMGYAEFLDSTWMTILIGSLVGFSLWSAHIWSTTKSTFKLYKMGGKLRIEAKTAKGDWEFTEPFKYRCYGEMVEVPARYVRIKRPNLYIVLEHSDGKKLLLQEDKSALKSMPPGWEQVEGRYELLECDLRLTQHGTTAIELEKLRRILDGLSSTKN